MCWLTENPVGKVSFFYCLSIIHICLAPPPSKNVYGGQQFFFALRTKYLALANPDKMSGCARAHAASHYWPMIFYQMLITDSQIIIATSLLTFQNACKIEFLIRANAKMETLICNSVVFKTLIIKRVLKTNTQRS